MIPGWFAGCAGLRLTGEGLNHMRCPLTAGMIGKEYGNVK